MRFFLKPFIHQNVPIDRITVKYCQLSRTFPERRQNLIDAFFKYLFVKRVVQVECIEIIIQRKICRIRPVYLYLPGSFSQIPFGNAAQLLVILNPCHFVEAEPAKKKKDETLPAPNIQH